MALQVLGDLRLNIRCVVWSRMTITGQEDFIMKIRESPLTKLRAFRLITRIQDEAHRFAIEYHRSLRSKDRCIRFWMILRGIGPARRKALMRNFMSLDAIKAASVEELAQIPSMNEKRQNLYKFFISDIIERRKC